MGNLTEALQANEKEKQLAIEKLLLIINQDEEILRKEDFDIFINFMKVTSQDEKVYEKLEELQKNGFIYVVEKMGGFLELPDVENLDDIEKFFVFAEWDIEKILNLTTAYMSMHTFLSILIKDKVAISNFKTICSYSEEESRIRLRNEDWTVWVKNFLDKNEIDFTALMPSDFTINEIATGKKEEGLAPTCYQLASSNNAFASSSFKEYITLEQLAKERNCFAQKNEFLFNLIQWLLENRNKISNLASYPRLLKLILVLAAQHSLDAVFNVVLTLILMYWGDNKLYKVNVIGIKNQLFPASVNLDFLLKLCNSEGGLLYKMLMQLRGGMIVPVSADQLFLCVPEDKVREWYNKIVFGATIAFDSSKPLKISTLAALQLGAPFDGIMVIYRSQDKNGFSIVSERLHNRWYKFLSMEKLASLIEVASDSEVAMTEIASNHALENNLKRKCEELNLAKNKRKKTEAIEANTSSENPFESLPDEIVLNIFRFFNLRESLEAGKVCKQFNRIAHDRSLAEAQYKHYKIVHRSDIPLSRKELKKAILKLQKAVEATMQELNTLPHWYGDINRGQAEAILDQFPDYSYLLHNAHDVEGAIVFSYKLSAKSTSGAISSSSSYLPLKSLEGALILPNVNKNIPLPEEQRGLSSSEFGYYLVRMVEGYDGVIFFMTGDGAEGYSSLSSLIKACENGMGKKLAPACIENLPVSRSLTI